MPASIMRFAICTANGAVPAFLKMIVHGSGTAMALLQATASDQNVDVEFNDDLHTISVQGPNARQLIDAHSSVSPSVTIRGSDRGLRWCTGFDCCSKAASVTGMLP